MLNDDHGNGVVFTVVKHLLKRDENNKRTYQSDGHVIYKNMTGIITESAFVLTFD